MKMKSEGLHHATSLGNIQLSEKSINVDLLSGRCYDSEDENMGRKKTRPIGSGLFPRTSVYSKGDIREQYCLSDRQLSSIERPRRDRFFGCLSGRGAPQSFLGVCVGRRAPSDENIADYAPFYKVPRYPYVNGDFPTPEIINDEDSYFRRRPTSFLGGSGNEAKHYTWMPADEDAIRLEGPRSIVQNEYDVNMGRHSGGPYVVSGNLYQSRSYISQSSEQVAGQFRCPAHIGVPPPPPPPIIHTDNIPRAKHVSFARSHTLTSFDEAAIDRPLTRLNSARSQERLIGGKKPSHPSHQISLQQVVIPLNAQPEVFVVEKLKRGAMKTQATQTDVFVGKKSLSSHHISLSPRTIHRVKMVSQGAQTNGLLNNRKLTKSLSEAITERKCNENGDTAIQTDELMSPIDHEPLFRTHSEEPPRSPYILDHSLSTKPFPFFSKATPSVYTPVPSTISGQSEIETSRSDIYIHSRNHSHDSAQSFQSFDISTSKASQDSVSTAFGASDRNKCRIAPDVILSSTDTDFCYESNSLPRRKCIHQEFHTHSLPRQDNHYQQTCDEQQYNTCHHREVEEYHNVPLTKTNEWDQQCPESIIDSKHLNNRRYSCDVQQMTSYGYQKPSYPISSIDPKRRQSQPINLTAIDAEVDGSQSDESCSTCDSDSDSKEIFIDFKPRISPEPTSRSLKHRRLQKTLSDGEILIDQKSQLDTDSLIASASDDDLILSKKEIDQNNLTYNTNQIKDEGIYERNNQLKPVDVEGTLRIKRDAFRKRSLSLEDLVLDGIDMSTMERLPPIINEFPSTDSIVNDLTRDHSDNIWNESQATVLHAESSQLDTGLLTPTTRRKNLLLQHQQRSSIDIEALELEDQYFGQTLKNSNSQSNQTATATVGLNASVAIIKPSISLTAPSISVTPSLSASELESYKMSMATSKYQRQKSRAISPHRRPNFYSRPTSDQENIHEPSETSKMTSSTSELNLNRSDSGKTNTDISECSTNTDDYVTCTETSKRAQGILHLVTAANTTTNTTQITVSTSSSQAITQEGSSFESASSVYSLARGDAICDDGIQSQSQVDSMDFPSPPLPPIPSTIFSIQPSKPSPSHSASSTSSGSYCLNGTKKPIKNTSISPSRTNSVKPSPISVVKTKKTGSVSDDDRSERRYSSSGYYESPHEDDKPIRSRKSRDYNEDERRRRKEKMRLEIERENIKSLTSPIKKGISPNFKQLSPDDRTALNILDGTSPIKGKRFRAKTRRAPRVRPSNEDTLPRRLKSTILSPEKPNECKLQSPSKLQKNTNQHLHHHQHAQSPPIRKRLGGVPTSDKRLQAISTESLRSVSPGSDSVFYSEVDFLPDQQVHCYHCGKEVEIITAEAGSQASLDELDDERSTNIVKPPAGFADSPDRPRTPQYSTRLYKKLDKRFRSEDRHAERRNIRNRQESTRAKSEERNKDDGRRVATTTLRPAGSSPCVVNEGSFNVRDQPADPEQGIYHGFYRLGTWICITDRDVWKKPDITGLEDRSHDVIERRGSTESEKDFRKKYQAITHRLVHRKSCVEMYRRQSSNSFKLVSSTAAPDTIRKKLEDLLKLMLVVWAKEGVAINKISGQKQDSDKTIIVQRKSGEFGFRIHGSKPVVVSAIEPETPAECSGLEVGDIVLSVNGVPVIDKSHSEVVKIAHAGSDVLELEVARTIGVVATESNEISNPSVYAGYLWRQGGYASGQPNNQKWVRRWFCLRPDHCLYFYKSDSDSQAVGAILLSNHTVEACSTEVGRPFSFRISSGDGIPLYLAADTEEAANRWIAVTCHAAKQSDPWLEISTRNLRLPPNSVPRPDCFGYLMKLGSKWRAWSKRYCVLKDACLYFYHDGNSKNAFGMACLQGYRVQQTNNTAGKKYAFEVAPPEAKLRHYYFSTESEMDKKRWIAALEYSIDRWMKAG